MIIQRRSFFETEATLPALLGENPPIFNVLQKHATIRGIGISENDRSRMSGNMGHHRQIPALNGKNSTQDIYAISIKATQMVSQSFVENSKIRISELYAFERSFSA